AIEWYASRQPAPGKAQKGKAIEEGERLYANGVESKGVQPCQSCHGTAAEGTDTVPRLAGQHAAYVFRQLALFRSGARRESPMAEIARNLETDEARALSHYLQSR
ncbi:MAG: c-type cytochrome, partial [Acidobacteriia bacterium]|nr:c-type cytochrome [Terriglobia bacterium]